MQQSAHTAKVLQIVAGGEDLRRSKIADKLADSLTESGLSNLLRWLENDELRLTQPRRPPNTISLGTAAMQHDPGTFATLIRQIDHPAGHG